MLVDVRSLAFRPVNQYLYKLKGYLNKYRLVTICLINSIINPASREVKNKPHYEWCHVFYLILWDVGYKCDERLQRDKLIIPKILTLLRSGLFCFLRPEGAPSESPLPPPPPFPHPSSNLSWYRRSRIMSLSFPTSRQWRVDVTMKSVSFKLLVDCSSGFPIRTG